MFELQNDLIRRGCNECSNDKLFESYIANLKKIS